jgi:hypothetical protein
MTSGQLNSNLAKSKKKSKLYTLQCSNQLCSPSIAYSIIFVAYRNMYIMGFINTKAKYHEYITFERLTTITLIDLLTYQASKQQLQWRSTTPIVLLLPPKDRRAKLLPFTGPTSCQSGEPVLCLMEPMTSLSRLLHKPETL